MNNSDRNTLLIGLRPDIVIDTERKSMDEELFQNNTLRPILKFQNELILAYFKNKTTSLKLPKETKEKLIFVENTIRKDAVLRNQLIGLIIGLFTADEFADYLTQATPINKRISQLLIKRIQDQV